MAPEVLEHQPYDERADVYSFAITVWELITARVPYCDMAPMQVGNRRVCVGGDGACGGEVPARTRLL